ncbi:MAG: DUF192 domain-containing protein [Patescibacteria group bacterium]
MIRKLPYSKYIALGVLIAVLGLAYVNYIKPSKDTTTGTIGNDKFSFQVAETPQERQLGLSGQPGLSATSGMLFIFDKPDIQCIWMKDMQFDLDILWFDQDSNLIHLERDVQLSSYPKSFCSPSAAKYVVEVNAGRSKELGWQLGDKLQFEKKQ